MVIIMWIRSQDKRGLVNATQIEVIGNSVRDLEHDVLLGSYKNQENAIKVLDKIQNRMIGAKQLKLISFTRNLGIDANMCKLLVYEMPQEEVEVDGIK